MFRIQEWLSSGAAVADDDNVKLVGSVVQAVMIMRRLARAGEPAGAAAIARDTGISVSTCFNILRTLAKERLVDFDPEAKTYRIGMGTLEFSIPLLGLNQAEIVRPELRRLAETSRSLICLWQVTENDRIVLVDRISSLTTVRIDVRPGARLPMLVGAVGRCVAAHIRLDRAELERRFAGLRWQNAPSFSAYLDDVRRAARDGYAFDDGNLFAGVEIVAALVTDMRGAARFGLSAISIGGQVSAGERLTLAAALRDSADWISETLFGLPRGHRAALRLTAGDAPPLPSRHGAE